MRFTSSLITFSIAALCLGLPACKSESPLSNSDVPRGYAPGSTPIPGGSLTQPVASIDAEVYLKIERQLQTPDNAERKAVGTCQVPTGSPRGTFVSCGPSVGGSFSIPEGDLYYSKLVFTAGTANPNTCSYLLFHPYYYIGSTAAGPPAAGFIPPWFRTPRALTGIECSPALAGKGCFNGAAVDLVPGFPSNVGFVFLTNTVNEMVATLDSAFNKLQNSNRYTANNAASWAGSYNDTSIDGVVSYVGDTNAQAAGYRPAAFPATPYGYSAAHQDYSVECRDKYYDLIFAVKVVLNDEDTSTGASVPLNEWRTWP